MGALSSKSPAERRNTVLRRSQRKSVHSVKGKTDKLIKDIKKYKGVEEDAAYIELKARIDTLERELKVTGRNLQPQIRLVYNEALKRTTECYQHLENKLAENKAKAPEVKDEEEKKDGDDKEDDNDDVFINEINNEEHNLEETPNKRQTVELKLIQVEPLEGSPQVNKRQSISKFGVPVMPGAILEDLSRRTQSLDLGTENRIAEIRKKIEQIELEISQFVGKKNGKYYNKIKKQLDHFVEELKIIPPLDDAIVEQIKLCNNYIGSCQSFLDEKAVEDDSEESEDSLSEEASYGRPPEGALNGTGIAYHPEFSSRTMRTTYI